MSTESGKGNVQGQGEHADGPRGSWRHGHWWQTGGKGRKTAKTEVGAFKILQTLPSPKTNMREISILHKYLR